MVKDDSHGLELTVDNRSMIAVEKLIKNFHESVGLPEDTKPLIMAPGARHKTKVWLVEHWADLMSKAYEAGYKSQVLVGSSEEMDLSQSISASVDHEILTTTGETGIGELIAMISTGRALISSDNGCMHIATAVGTPVAAIFGPTVPEFGFSPFRAVSEVVQIDEELFCRPCHPHGPDKCPLKHFRCMKEINPDMVFDALKRMDERGVNDVKFGV